MLKNLKKYQTQILNLTLILFCLNTSAFSQNDSTLCFTKAQVRTFLITKVELNNCIESSNVLMNQLEDVRATNETLTIDYTKSKKKLKRTRWIAGGGILATILLSVVLIL